MMESIERLRKWVRATREDGLGPMGTNLYELGEIADEIEREIAERYMELPVDADGVPIHFGDIVEGELLLDNATVRGTVRALHLYEDDPDTVYIKVNTQGGWTIKELRLTNCRHVKPRTLEDVLDEMADEIIRQGHQAGLTAPDIIAKYADELREMGVQDD